MSDLACCISQTVVAQTRAAVLASASPDWLTGLAGTASTHCDASHVLEGAEPGTGAAPPALSSPSPPRPPREQRCPASLARPPLASRCRGAARERSLAPERRHQSVDSTSVLLGGGGRLVLLHQSDAFLLFFAKKRAL
jgi:hypothetical protein